jgi:PadR family transcriptional regulator, regulatory protein PadR
VEYSEEGRDRRITQLRKGILELAVMGVLCHERHYGYSLVSVLGERGCISLKEGTIYPILSRLDRDGLVGSEWVESDQGPPRKYYALTELGRRLFDELSRDFDSLVSLVRQTRKSPQQSCNVGEKLVVRKR